MTTEEVLTEYLTFFCASPEYLRREVVSNVEAILHDPAVRVIPQATILLLPGLNFIAPVPTKGTVWSIVFLCRRCAGKG